MATLNMVSDKGFTLIEVLIASIILFLSIVTVSLAYRQYINYKLKQEKYEKIFISALSLMSKIESEDLDKLTNRSGTINGLKYHITIRKVASKRNYVYGLTESTSGNIGPFLLTLFRVRIDISNKSFVLYITSYRKLKKA